MLHELSSPTTLQSFLTSHPQSLLCFSATWCGPCKASKPQFESLCASFVSDNSISVECGIVYEHVLGNEIASYNVRAFPTYVVFQGTQEMGRVEGVNFEKLKGLVTQFCSASSFGGEGTALGGSVSGEGEGGVVSVEEARRRRLEKLGAAPAAAAAPALTEDTMATETAKDKDMNDAHETNPNEIKDATMTDVESTMMDPTANLNQDDIDTLTTAMGFSLLRAQKGLLYGSNQTIEGAVEWLTQHQEDEDIDDPIPLVPANNNNNNTNTSAAVAQSYKCNECGKLLSNMANLELHANKTGHSDFEESTQSKAPLTAEQKQAKIAEIKQLLKAKRQERENEEKATNIDREKQRRFMGKEMAKTREQMEAEARKRQALMKRKEKEAALKERARIRAELEKDKRERAANKGKLGSKLGVDGYNPDAIQYDVSVDGGDMNDNKTEAKKPKKIPPSAAKLDEYIAKVSSYRAGGDGGNCLKVLKAYITNVVDHPEEDKYKKINTENKAYKTKVKPFLGAKNLLLAVGFSPGEDGASLVLEEDADRSVLVGAKEKLEDAYEKYMKWWFGDDDDSFMVLWFAILYIVAT